MTGDSPNGSSKTSPFRRLMETGIREEDKQFHDKNRAFILRRARIAVTTFAAGGLKLECEGELT
jgi:hypothetical protein